MTPEIALLIQWLPWIFSGALLTVFVAAFGMARR